MVRTIQMAGYFSAHSIHCICEGETLTPLIGYDTREEGGFFRIEGDEPVERGMQWLLRNPKQVLRAIFIYDAIATYQIHGSKLRADSLIIEAVKYAQAEKSFQITVPYRHAEKPKGFAVHKPKVTRVDGLDKEELEMLIDHFWIGVDEHKEGSAIWRQCLDQSF